MVRMKSPERSNYPRRRFLVATAAAIAGTESRRHQRRPSAAQWNKPA